MKRSRFGKVMWRTHRQTRQNRILVRPNSTKRGGACCGSGYTRRRRYTGSCGTALNPSCRAQHAQQMVGHESRRKAKLCDRTQDDITLSETERIRL